MLTIRDLINAGFKIRLNTGQAIEYADIEYVKNLSIEDLVNGSYEHNIVDSDYGDFLKEIWLEKDGIGGKIRFGYFELIMFNSDSMKEFQESLTKINTIFARMSFLKTWF